MDEVIGIKYKHYNLSQLGYPSGIEYLFSRDAKISILRYDSRSILNFKNDITSEIALVALYYAHVQDQWSKSFLSLRNHLLFTNMVLKCIDSDMMPYINKEMKRLKLIGLWDV